MGGICPCFSCYCLRDRNKTPQHAWLSTLRKLLTCERPVEEIHRQLRKGRGKPVSKHGHVSPPSLSATLLLYASADPWPFELHRRWSCPAESWIRSAPVSWSASCLPTSTSWMRWENRPFLWASWHLKWMLLRVFGALFSMETHNPCNRVAANSSEPVKLGPAVSVLSIHSMVLSDFCL